MRLEGGCARGSKYGMQGGSAQDDADGRRTGAPCVVYPWWAACRVNWQEAVGAGVRVSGLISV
jgi:hypothetical protein